MHYQLNLGFCVGRGGLFGLKNFDFAYFSFAFLLLFLTYAQSEIPCIERGENEKTEREREKMKNNKSLAEIDRWLIIDKQ